MTLNTLSAFLTVAEEMNFTRAAQRLFITQQSLSGHVKRLEEEYGVTLFERRPTLRLTAEGENMVFYARQILQAERSMVSEFADLSSRREAYLDLGISYMRSVMLGGGIWKRFHAAHPNIQLRLVEANTSALIECLQRGEVALMVGVDIRPVAGLKVLPLMREALCCVIHRNLCERHCPDAAQESSGAGGLVLGGPVTIRRLGEVPIMFPARGNRLRLSLERMYRNAGTRPRILLESERQDVLYQLACAGEGAAFVSPMVLYAKTGSSLALPPDCHVFRLKDAGYSTLSMAVPDDVRLPRYAQSMMEAIRETFRDYAEAIAGLGLAGP